MKIGQFKSAQRGSALITTIIFTTMLLLVSGSVLGWSISERRLNQRHALRLEARNAAEAAAEYGFAQVRYKMDNRTSFPTTLLDPSGSDALASPPTGLFSGGNIDIDSIELIGGTVGDATAQFINPSDPNNQFDTMKGKYVFRRDVQILARATAKMPNGPSVTSYVVETLAMRETPLFAHAIFYNMDLELAPGADMTIYGPVHSNGNLWVTGQNSSNNSKLNFVGPVTVTGGLYHGYEITPKMGNGSAEATTNEPVQFVNKAGSLIDLRKDSVWRDQKMGQASETTDTQSSFRSFASNTYNGYLQTGLHGVENYKPVAFGEYQKDTTPDDGIDQSVNTGRAIIEPPIPSTDSANYKKEIEEQKLSRKSGLYITVNPSSASLTGRKPDGTAVTVPAGQYRAFKADGTEVILPGSTTATAGTNHPNLPGGASPKRPIIQVKPQQMTDLRRFTDFNYNSSRSSSNRYDPKQINIIEVDMTALKMAVDRTVNGAGTSTIYPYDSNSSDSTYRATSTTSQTLTAANSIQNFNASDWNGAVYIESIGAETRRDSGVRLINGRGPVASTAPNSATEGLTISTNDAVYVLGHFNADGTLDTTAGSATNSSRFPESASEIPVAIAGDAITILSQPTFTTDGSGNSNQTGGWNDRLSDVRVNSSNWSTNWATTNPSGSNRYEGSNAERRPGANPMATTSSTTGSTRTTKLQGQNTEIAAALLTGITPSNKNGSNQYSGGAHNFPRLLEHWNGTLSIRGSMVALFESRVATEPWSIRVYNAPARHWGFNEMFAGGRYPPQTPRVRTYRRVDFRDVTADEYAQMVSDLPW